MKKLSKKAWIGFSVGVLALTILIPVLTFLYDSNKPVPFNDEYNKPIDLNGTTLLLKAVQDNDVKKVKALLKAGANPNVTDKYGDTALMFATVLDRQDIAKELLENKADPNVKRKDGLSPTMAAATSGKTEILHQFIKSGGDVNAKDPNGNTAFILETINILVGQNQSIDILKALAEAGADVNTRNKFGHTALSMAVERKNKKLVDFLKSLGARGETKTQSQIPIQNPVPDDHHDEESHKSNS